MNTNWLKSLDLRLLDSNMIKHFSVRSGRQFGKSRTNNFVFRYMMGRFQKLLDGTQTIYSVEYERFSKVLSNILVK